MSVGEVGRLVGGRFRIDRELERDAAMQSLLVTDLRSGRPCVLRMLSLAAASPTAVRRFEAQAEILAKLDHAGLPRFVAGFAEGEGETATRVVVTTYHPGENLARLVAKGRPLTESQALVLLRRLTPVLAYLHAFEPPLVHRTISATGIILGPDGRPCLTDLDYAGVESETPLVKQAPPGPEELALAAPEVYMDGAVPASDIYALGLAVCRGMSGREPAQLLREGARLQLRGALGASEAFAAVIARMLEASLERRYPDVNALDADLARLAGERGAPAQQPQVRVAEEPRRSRRFRPLLLAGSALVLVALAGFALRQRSRPEPGVSLLVTPPPERTAPSALQPASDAAPGPGAAPAPEQARAAPNAVGAGPGLQESPAPPAPVVTLPAPTPMATPAPTPTATPSETGAAAVEMRLRLEGRPFIDPGAPAPKFWLRDEGTKAVEQPKVERVGDGDVYTIRDLAPGRYGMGVRIDLNTTNPGRYPGDLDAWVQFTVAAGNPVSIEVPLRRIIRLLQPVDTNAAVPGWEAPCGSGSVHPGKMVFAWEPLPGAVSYLARVERLACSRGYASEGTVFTHTTGDAWVKVDLPPSADEECYSFSLTARSGGVAAGIMTTHGATGLGWDYRFTVAGGR